jgi:hypothetical protein
MTNSGVIVLVAIAVKYTVGAFIVIEASLRERDDAHRVCTVGRRDLDVRASESVMKSQAAEVVWFGFLSFAYDEHPVVRAANGPTA